MGNDIKKLTNMFLEVSESPTNMKIVKKENEIVSINKEYYENLQFIEFSYFKFIKKIVILAIICSSWSIVFVTTLYIVPFVTGEKIPYSTIEVLAISIITTPWAGLIVNAVLGFTRIHRNSSAILKEKNRLDKMNNLKDS